MIPPAMRARRAPLILAALLLAATAVFHLTGLSMVADWFEGAKRTIMILLWITPAASWLLIAVFWMFKAVRGVSLDWSVLMLTAVIPLLVGVPLLALVSPMHPGGWMLVAASVLAFSSRRRGRR